MKKTFLKSNCFKVHVLVLLIALVGCTPKVPQTFDAMPTAVRETVIVEITSTPEPTATPTPPFLPTPKPCPDTLAKVQAIRDTVLYEGPESDYVAVIVPKGAVGRAYGACENSRGMISGADGIGDDTGLLGWGELIDFDY